MPSTIYLLKDPRDGAPRYVGVTNNLKKRVGKHFRQKSKTHCGRWISLLKDIGMEPVVEILETVEDEDREIVEIAWILGFRIAGYDLTNLTMGGEGTICPSNEIREKRRERMLGNKYALGHKPSPEHNEKLRLRSIGNTINLGRKASLETREKIGRAGRGRICSSETREKIGSANRGRIASVETREKIGNASRGRKVSPETREKLSKASLGNKRTLGYVPTPETREKLRVAGLGNKNALGGKGPVGNKHTLGRKHTPETKEKLRQANLGHIVTTETREKISRANLGRKHSIKPRGETDLLLKERMSVI